MDLGFRALGVRPHLHVGEIPVAHGHDGAVLGPGRHLQLRRAALLVDDQAVVPSRLEGVVQALHAGAVGSGGSVLHMVR